MSLTEVLDIVTKIKKPLVVQGDQSKENLGLVHVVTGDGKGKTTSSLGLALRALGCGYKVHMIQFLKSGGTGELYAARHLPDLTIEQVGVDALKEKQKSQTGLGSFSSESADTTGRFIFQPDIAEKDAARFGFDRAKEILEKQQHDVLILDEINCVLDKGLISLPEMLAMINSNGNTELLLTGRDAPESLYEHVDYVNVVQRIKHPWQKKIKARKGIEY